VCVVGHMLILADYLSGDSGQLLREEQGPGQDHRIYKED
jgi:hypothetical protein